RTAYQPGRRSQDPNDPTGQDPHSGARQRLSDLRADLRHQRRAKGHRHQAQSSAAAVHFTSIRRQDPPMRILVALVATCAPLLCADQVVLKNGDILTGAIVKKDGRKLTLNSEYLGDVTMTWNAVKSINSDETITVVLPDGEAVAGKVSTANGRLEVA